MREKVNWREEYRLDNLFNIFIALLMVVAVIFFPLGEGEGSLRVFIIILAIASLIVNASAAGFFNKRKYK